MAEGSDRNDSAGSDETAGIVAQAEAAQRLIEDMCRELIDKAGMQPGEVYRGLLLSAVNAWVDGCGPFTASRLFTNIATHLRDDAAKAAQLNDPQAG